MAGMKRAASMLLMLLMLVWAICAKPPAADAVEPARAVAVVEGLPESEANGVADAGDTVAAPAETAGEADGAAAAVSGSQAMPDPEACGTDGMDDAQATSIKAGNTSVQMAAFKAMSMPEIPAGAPAPAQIKSLPDSGMMCLTFDDGYSRSSIETILGCLREHDVHCTFFIIGTCLKLYPELWRQAVEDGHEIAYHTMNHRPLTRRSNAQIVADLNEWNQTAMTVLGIGYRIPKIARAPGGTTDARVRRLFSALGYSLIYWSCDTFTGVYRRNHSNAGARVAGYILKHAASGAISLQHFNAYDAASVSRYIGEIKECYQLGTVSEALAAAEMRVQKELFAETLKQRSLKPDFSGMY